MDLSLVGLSGPVVVSVMAGGVSDVSFGYCESFEGETFCFITHSVQNPIVWQDPLVFLPASISASQSAAARFSLPC